MRFYFSETAVKKFGMVNHHVGYLHIEVISNRSTTQHETYVVLNSVILPACSLVYQGVIITPLVGFI